MATQGGGRSLANLQVAAPLGTWYICQHLLTRRDLRLVQIVLAGFCTFQKALRATSGVAGRLASKGFLFGVGDLLCHLSVLRAAH